MAVPNAESAESRFERDWMEIQDDRRERGLEQQPDERLARRYVSPEGVSATGATSDYVEEAYSD